MFADHLAAKRRNQQSGASSEAVTDCTDFWTNITETFHKFCYEERPSMDPAGCLSGNIAVEAFSLD